MSDDAYPKANDGAAMQAITNKYASTFKPDVVYLTSEEQIAGVMVPLEAALTAARAVNRPYYVLTDTLKTKTLLDAIARPFEITSRHVTVLASNAGLR